MTPRDMAAIHATAFDRPWDAAAFEGLMAQDGVAAFDLDDGFVLVRAAAGEAEILTLAVRPEARRRGLGLRLTQGAADLARSLGAAVLHLEVAEDNEAALALYRRAGFSQAGRRPRYYARLDGMDVTAILLSLNLA